MQMASLCLCSTTTRECSEAALPKACGVSSSCSSRPEPAVRTSHCTATSSCRMWGQTTHWALQLRWHCTSSRAGHELPHRCYSWAVHHTSSGTISRHKVIVRVIANLSWNEKKKIYRLILLIEDIASLNICINSLRNKHLFFFIKQ